MDIGLLQLLLASKQSLKVQYMDIGLFQLLLASKQTNISFAVRKNTDTAASYMR
jgi:hypothetical protein